MNYLIMGAITLATLGLDVVKNATAAPDVVVENGTLKNDYTQRIVSIAYYAGLAVAGYFVYKKVIK